MEQARTGSDASGMAPVLSEANGRRRRAHMTVIASPHERRSLDVHALDLRSTL